MNKWKSFFWGFVVAANVAFLFDNLLKKDTYGIMINRPIDLAVEILVIVFGVIFVASEE